MNAHGGAQGTGQRAKPATPEGRLRVRIVLTARAAQWADERLYARASAIVGRTLRPGFGLSTCDLGELERIWADVQGQPAAAGPRGPRRSGRRAEPGVTRIASVKQLWKIEALRQELHLSEAEIAGILRQATHGRTVRARTAGDAHLAIEALLAIRARWAKRSRQDGRNNPVSPVNPVEEAVL